MNSQLKIGPEWGIYLYSLRDSKINQFSIMIIVSIFFSVSVLVFRPAHEKLFNLGSLVPVTTHYTLHFMLARVHTLLYSHVCALTLGKPFGGTSAGTRVGDGYVLPFHIAVVAFIIFLFLFKSCGVFVVDTLKYLMCFFLFQVL